MEGRLMHCLPESGWYVMVECWLGLYLLVLMAGHGRPKVAELHEAGDGP